MTTREEADANNWVAFMRQGAGLSYNYNSYVLKRNTANGRVLLGGLGGMGMGQMWFDENEHTKDKPGYAEAEIVTDATIGLGSFS